MISVDFEKVFNALPANYLVYDLDMTIVAVTDATLGDAMVRDQVVGRSQFEVFPDNPDAPEGAGQAAMEAAFARVLRERRGHEMPVTRYDIADADGAFRETYFKPVNEPVFDAYGKITHIIHGVVDVSASHSGGGDVTRQ